MTPLVAVALAVLFVGTAFAFSVPCPPSQQRRRRRVSSSSILLWNSDNKNNNDDNDDEGSSMNPLTKASWYGVEWFGKAFGSSKSSKKSSSFSSSSSTIIRILDDDGNPVLPQTLQETVQRIENDNDRSYFLSGQVDQGIYDPDCVFSDPFVSFSGTERFVTNLANLGSFITKYKAKVLQNSQVDDTTIQTKVRILL
jgi:hypothetical protein